MGRPDLTADKFISNPCLELNAYSKSWVSAYGNESKQHPYEKVYKTGDLVSWTADGAISFLGRIDDQVKVRGGSDF